MRRPSLTLRLTLLFGTASTAVLVVLGYLVGIAVQGHFAEIDGDELRGKVELVRHTLAKLRTAEDFASMPGRMDDALIGHPHLGVRLSASDGTLLYASADATFPAEEFPLRLAEGLPTSPAIATWRHGRHSFRGTMTSVPTGYAGMPRANLAVAVSIDHHVAFFEAFARSLWISIAAGALLTAALGWVAARRGLLPVREMTAVARSISASRLHDRLRVETLPPELTPLATAFNEMLARLEDSFRRLSDFSSDLAHEFKTPLSNVMTQTEVALSRSRSPDEYREVLYSSLEECDRLARTVSDMLFLAKADHGQVIPTRERIDLAREVRELFEFYDAFVEERRVALDAAGEGSVDGDRLMLRRAIGNLLSNAIAHTARGGRVTVSIAASHDGTVRLAVENPGKTIPPEHLPRLFDRFYRADPARQRSTGGAGLGLAITRSIVTAHGGSIAVTSKDGLTRFEMSLPAGSGAVLSPM
ncbi:MAG: heavy metal sensor histidine kinase [Burkholderiales bacterium]|nr:heavy metal sensor histidine kinase [Burkholderiales bacterium]